MPRNVCMVLGAALLLSSCSQKEVEASKSGKSGPQPISVRTAQASTRVVERSRMVTGSLRADETVSLSSEVAGRVKSIHFDFGQPVRAGQVVAELDATEYRLQVERARANLQQALARVGLTLSSAENTVPESTPAIRQAQAQLEDARMKFERSQRLVKTGDISQESFIAAEKAYQARQAAFDAQQDDMMTQLATIRALRADLKLAEKKVRDCSVVAPFDGSITEKQVSPGQYIKENVAILTLVKTSPLRLMVEIPESTSAEVRVGTTLAFTTDSAPGETFTAAVRQLNPSLDSKARVLTAEARIEKPDVRLRPGSFVQVRLITDKNTSVLSIPRSAIYTIAGLNKFFTIEGGKAVEHHLEQTSGGDDWVEVPQGMIPEGATVAVSSVPLLSAGAPVTTGRS